MKKKRAPPPRARPGIARQHLNDFFESTSEDELVRNGHVLRIYLETSKSIAKTIRGVQSSFGAAYFSMQPNDLQRVTWKFNRFQNFSRDWKQFTEFCDEPFKIPVRPSATAERQELPDETANDFDSEPVPSSSTLSPPLPMDVAESDHLTAPILDHVEFPAATTDSSSGSISGSSEFVAPARSRKLDVTPRKAKMCKRLEFVAKMRSSEKRKYAKRLKALKSQLDVERLAKIKYLHQDIKRKKHSMRLKDAQIALLKKQLKEAKCRTCHCDNAETGSALVKLRRSHERLKKARSRKRQSHGDKDFVSVEDHWKLKRELSRKDEVISSLENRLLEQEEIVEQLTRKDEKKLTKKDEKTYSLDTRMKVYDCIVNQVPTKSIPLVIESDARRTGEKLTSVPQRSIVDQMVRELDVIADLKAAEFVMKKPNLTLGFDATTQEGTHINSIHITSIEECEVLDIAELAGGTADDYHDHVTHSVDNLASVYADFHQEEYGYARSTMIKNISNTMTDRVSVNHAAIRKVNETWGKTLNELNCHLHPLDTIASTCRSALKSLESTRGHLFGKDCMAGNLVLQINKFRYKDGKGDPKGFKTFLAKKKLPQSLIPRYRGNRLHIIFHICGILYQYYDSFLEFFTTGSVSCGGLQSSIREDFQNPTAILEIQVLGLLGKLLTGPWMQIFYKSMDSEISHLDGIRTIKDVVARLKLASADPQAILDRTEDFFGRTLSADDITLEKLVVFRGSDCEEEFKDNVKACLAAVIAVLERQYKRYFDMELTPALGEETASARLHNIDAEGIIGMYGTEKEKSKNARIDFLRAKMRAKKNRVVPYLDSLSKPTRERIVNWAVRRARVKRKDSRRKQVEIRMELMKRATSKNQKKAEKERKELEKKLRSVDVSQIGTTFPHLNEVTKADLEELLSGAIVGKKILHTWYDDNNGSKTVFCGKVEKQKKRKGVEYFTIAYWKENGSYDEDAEDSLLTKYELGADLIAGDLEFC